MQTQQPNQSAQALQSPQAAQPQVAPQPWVKPTFEQAPLNEALATFIPGDVDFFNSYSS